jgi:hypothetical protein
MPSGNGYAGAPNKVEISSEMIEAGIGALAVVRHRSVADEVLVEMVYNAMAELKENCIGEIARETVKSVA